MKVITQIRKNFIITPNDLLKLLKHSDDLDIHKIKRRILTIYVATYTTIAINAIFYSIFYIIVVSTNALNISNFYDISNRIFFLIAFLIILNTFDSFFTNYFLSVNSAELLNKDFNVFRKEFFNLFTNKMTVTFGDMCSRLFTYNYNLKEILINLLLLLFTLATLASTSINTQTKFLLGFISLATIVLFSASGYIYIKNALKIRDVFLQNKTPAKKTVIKRVAAPLTSNIFNEIVFPLTIVMFSVFKLNEIIPQVAFLATVAKFTWSIVMNIENFKIAKTTLTKLTKKFDKLTKNYVINQRGFYKQCKLTKPNPEILKKSLENKSLILKDFIPMGITNGKKSKRKVNFEFTPGVYQLNGLNGVGKTTLLQALGIPKESKVEYSHGQAAYYGKPLFDCKKSLKAHRSKIMFLGKNTQPEKKNKNLKLENLDNYKRLVKFAETLNNRHSDSYSEGESAVFLILEAIEKVKNGQIIIIDELLSRIYEDKEIKLRTTMIDVLLGFIKKSEAIVIVVDHVTKLEGITQLTMSYPAKIKVSKPSTSQ